MHLTLSDLLEVIGVALIVSAAVAVDGRLGAAVLGLVLVIVGFLLGEDDDDGEGVGP